MGWRLIHNGGGSLSPLDHRDEYTRNRRSCPSGGFRLRSARRAGTDTGMITRHHTKGDAPSTAVYSDCERYRYALTRVWDTALPRVLFVMLNPSKATEVQNDPTVERCERRARHLGYGAFQVTNIFAFRATDPRDMRAAADPIGAENDAALAEGAAWADHIIAAWGVHGAHLGRGPAVGALLLAQDKPLFHLGLSKAGHPKHPLYLPYAQQPQRWKPVKDALQTSLTS